MTQIAPYVKEQAGLPVPTVIEQEANALVVVDDDTDEFAAETISTLMARRDVVEKKRVEYVTPLNNLVKTINGDFKPVIESFDRAIATIKGKRQKLLNDRQAAARLAQEEANKAAAEEKARMEAAAASLAVKEPERAAAIIEAASFVAPPVIESPTVKGARKTVTGVLYDVSAFLAYAATDPGAAAACEFKASVLNALAKAHPKGLPGMRVLTEDKITGRKA